MKVKIHGLDKLVLSNRVPNWCQLPYPRHPKGCPNYDKRENCPPNTEPITNLIKPPFLLVGIRFNLGGHIKRMKEIHPEWSNAQARCVLYWQNKVMKRLREECEHVKNRIPNPKVFYCPEGYYVNVFKTASMVGIKLKTRPKKYVWKIAIIGVDR